MNAAVGRNRAKAVRYHVAVGARVLRVEVEGDTVRVEGARDEIQVLEGSRDGSLCLLVGDRPHRVFGSRIGEAAWEVQHRGRSFRVEVADERSWRMSQARGKGATAAAGLEPLRAPMPGLVLRVDVEEGQEIVEGQGLLIVEAMKMENELRARAPGRVRRVKVAAGESVSRGDVLIEFEPATADEGDPSGDGPVAEGGGARPGRADGSDQAEGDLGHSRSRDRMGSEP